jgi:hypothetical protein
MTQYLVQTPLQSESYVYISRLVKTRDPYPGLFQLAFGFHIFPVCLPFFVLFFGVFLSSISFSNSTLVSIW